MIHSVTSIMASCHTQHPNTVCPLPSRKRALSHSTLPTTNHPTQDVRAGFKIKAPRRSTPD
ncbi:hypothetical protein I7I50_11847 [Histoplasma capsulatum G186AR]|uniref:Uncharacterized protein n=1 Tax=Ajellomyces capsulatus TaxID=5037 RepID=A0A8H7Z8V1_AJECA|nr:hypothetical protein I7I52_03085 [Histoplasma capsulatum]QSS70274.1 hypothetical protein I7I50_11847 [Histoplasma capsulatum G186AR]